MQKRDYYVIEKNINKINRGENTNFLDTKTIDKITSKLKNSKYKIYYPYKDSDKAIIYINKLPQIKLLEILSYEKLTHRDILGSLYGLNINSEMFGDIIISDNHYYIIIMDTIYNIINNYYNMVGKHSIKLKEIPIETISNYTKKFEEVELIVSSIRIDNIASRLIGTSRDNIKQKFSNDEVILNYEPCHKINYKLKTNDIFSIRKHGKYKFIDIIKTNKKGNYIIKCQKYIDN